MLRLAELLRESLYGSVAITVLFAVAAVCNWQSGSAWLAQRAADRLRDTAVVAVYVLAGVPAAVDLTYDLASLHVDTHVLMTLAVIGTLLIGGALEVIPCVAVYSISPPCLMWALLCSLGLVEGLTYCRLLRLWQQRDWRSRLLCCAGRAAAGTLPGVAHGGAHAHLAGHWRLARPVRGEQSFWVMESAAVHTRRKARAVALLSPGTLHQYSMHAPELVTAC